MRAERLTGPRGGIKRDEGLNYHSSVNFSRRKTSCKLEENYFDPLLDFQDVRYFQACMARYFHSTQEEGYQR